MKRNVVALTTRREEAEAAALTAVRESFNEARLTVVEAATEANVSVNTIRRAYESGHLQVIRFGVGGRSLRIRRGAVAAWLDAGGLTRR